MASDVNVYALLCVCRCIHTDPNNTHTMPLSPLDVQVSLSGFPTFPGPGRALEERRLGMGCPLSRLGFLRCNATLSMHCRSKRGMVQIR